MKKVLIPIICGLLFSAGAMAQAQTYSFTLQEAVDYAYQNQINMKNAELDVDIAKNQVKETVSIGLPQVNGTGSLTKYFDIPTQLVPAEFFGGAPGTFAPVQFGTNYNMNYGLEASQLIFDGTYIVGLQAAKTFKELSQKSLTRTRIETSVAVTKAYYSVLAAKEGLKLITLNADRVGVNLREADAYYKAGLVEKIDADRLHVVYNNLTTEKENLERLVSVSYDVLKFQMGVPKEAQLDLKDSLQGIQTQELLTEIPPVKPEERIEYSLVQTQIHLNELDYKRYNFSRAPSIAAFGTYNFSHQENDFSKLMDNSYKTSLIGVSVKIPIIGSGQKWYQAKQAKLAVQKSKNDLLNLENSIFLEAKSAETTFRNQMNALKNQRENMDLANEVLKVTTAKYKEGVGSGLELTTAETDFKEAQSNYITALFNALNAKVDMDRAYGKIK